eukprot:5590958-Prymnesium_polylepis.1
MLSDSDEELAQPDAGGGEVHPVRLDLPTEETEALGPRGCEFLHVYLKDYTASLVADGLHVEKEKDTPVEFNVPHFVNYCFAMMDRQRAEAAERNAALLLEQKCALETVAELNKRLEQEHSEVDLSCDVADACRAWAREQKREYDIEVAKLQGQIAALKELVAPAPAPSQ